MKLKTLLSNFTKKLAKELGFSREQEAHTYSLDDYDNISVSDHSASLEESYESSQSEDAHSGTNQSTNYAESSEEPPQYESLLCVTPETQVSVPLPSTQEDCEKRPLTAVEVIPGDTEKTDETDVIVCGFSSGDLEVKKGAKKLGAGGYGSVYEGRFQDKPCAVKNFHTLLNEAAVETEQQLYRTSYFENEVEIQKSLNHPNVVKFLSCYLQWYPTPLQLLAMEKLDGSLDKYLSEDHHLDKRKVLSGVASALEYIHGHRIVHGDINPYNILLAKDGTAKVGDFGCAQRFSGQVCPGNSDFMPPEVHMYPNDKNGERHPPSVKTDMFSFGLVVLYVYDGHDSSQDPDIKDRFDGSAKAIPEAIRRATLLQRVKFKMPEALYDFAIRCIDPNPAARPTASEFPHQPLIDPSSGQPIQTVEILSALESSIHKPTERVLDTAVAGPHSMRLLLPEQTNGTTASQHSSAYKEDRAHDIGANLDQEVTGLHVVEPFLPSTDLIAGQRPLPFRDEAVNTHYSTPPCANMQSFYHAGASPAPLRQAEYASGETFQHTETFTRQPVKQPQQTKISVRELVEQTEPYADLPAQQAMRSDNEQTFKHQIHVHVAEQAGTHEAAMEVKDKQFKSSINQPAEKTETFTLKDPVLKVLEVSTDQLPSIEPAFQYAESSIGQTNVHGAIPQVPTNYKQEEMPTNEKSVDQTETFCRNEPFKEALWSNVQPIENDDMPSDEVAKYVQCSSDQHVESSTSITLPRTQTAMSAGQPVGKNDPSTEPLLLTTVSIQPLQQVTDKIPAEPFPGTPPMATETCEDAEHSRDQLVEQTDHTGTSSEIPPKQAVMARNKLSTFKQAGIVTDRSEQIIKLLLKNTCSEKAISSTDQPLQHNKSSTNKALNQTNTPIQPPLKQSYTVRPFVIKTVTSIEPPFRYDKAPILVEKASSQLVEQATAFTESVQANTSSEVLKDAKFSYVEKADTSTSDQASEFKACTGQSYKQAESSKKGQSVENPTNDHAKISNEQQLKLAEMSTDQNTECSSAQLVIGTFPAVSALNKDAMTTTNKSCEQAKSSTDSLVESSVTQTGAKMLAEPSKEIWTTTDQTRKSQPPSDQFTLAKPDLPLVQHSDPSIGILFNSQYTINEYTCKQPVMSTIQHYDDDASTAQNAEISTGAPILKQAGTLKDKRDEHDSTYKAVDTSTIKTALTEQPHKQAEMDLSIAYEHQVKFDELSADQPINVSMGKSLPQTYYLNEVHVSADQPMVQESHTDHSETDAEHSFVKDEALSDEPTTVPAFKLTGTIENQSIDSEQHQTSSEHQVKCKQLYTDQPNSLPDEPVQSTKPLVKKFDDQLFESSEKSSEPFKQSGTPNEVSLEQPQMPTETQTPWMHSYTEQRVRLTTDQPKVLKISTEKPIEQPEMATESQLNQNDLCTDESAIQAVILTKEPAKQCEGSTKRSIEQSSTEQSANHVESPTDQASNNQTEQASKPHLKQQAMTLFEQEGTSKDQSLVIPIEQVETIKDVSIEHDECFTEDCDELSISQPSEASYCNTLKVSADQPMVQESHTDHSETDAEHSFVKAEALNDEPTTVPAFKLTGTIEDQSIDSEQHQTSSEHQVKCKQLYTDQPNSLTDEPVQSTKPLLNKSDDQLFESSEKSSEPFKQSGTPNEVSLEQPQQPCIEHLAGHDELSSDEPLEMITDDTVRACCDPKQTFSKPTIKQSTHNTERSEALPIEQAEMHADQPFVVCTGKSVKQVGPSAGQSDKQAKASSCPPVETSTDKTQMPSETQTSWKHSDNCFTEQRVKLTTDQPKVLKISTEKLIEQPEMATESQLNQNDLCTDQSAIQAMILTKEQPNEQAKSSADQSAKHVELPIDQVVNTSDSQTETATKPHLKQAKISFEQEGTSKDQPLVIPIEQLKPPVIPVKCPTGQVAKQTSAKIKGVPNLTTRSSVHGGTDNLHCPNSNQSSPCLSSGPKVKKKRENKHQHSPERNKAQVESHKFTTKKVVHHVDPTLTNEEQCSPIPQHKKRKKSKQGVSEPPKVKKKDQRHEKKRKGEELPDLSSKATVLSTGPQQTEDDGRKLNHRNQPQILNCGQDSSSSNSPKTSPIHSQQETSSTQLSCPRASVGGSGTGGGGGRDDEEKERRDCSSNTDSSTKEESSNEEELLPTLKAPHNITSRPCSPSILISLSPNHDEPGQATETNRQKSHNKKRVKVKASNFTKQPVSHKRRSNLSSGAASGLPEQREKPASGDGGWRGNGSKGRNSNSSAKKKSSEIPPTDTKASHSQAPCLAPCFKPFVAPYSGDDFDQASEPNKLQSHNRKRNKTTTKAGLNKQPNKPVSHKDVPSYAGFWRNQGPKKKLQGIDRGVLESESDSDTEVDRKRDMTPVREKAHCESGSNSESEGSLVKLKHGKGAEWDYLGHPSGEDELDTSDGESEVTRIEAEVTLVWPVHPPEEQLPEPESSCGQEKECYTQPCVTLTPHQYIRPPEHFHGNCSALDPACTCKECSHGASSSPSPNHFVRPPEPKPKGQGRAEPAVVLQQHVRPLKRELTKTSDGPCIRRKIEACISSTVDYGQGVQLPEGETLVKPGGVQSAKSSDGAAAILPTTNQCVLPPEQCKASNKLKATEVENKHSTGASVSLTQQECLRPPEQETSGISGGSNTGVSSSDTRMGAQLVPSQCVCPPEKHSEVDKGFGEREREIFPQPIQASEPSVPSEYFVYLAAPKALPDCEQGSTFHYSLHPRVEQPTSPSVFQAPCGQGEFDPSTGQCGPLVTTLEDHRPLQPFRAVIRQLLQVSGLLIEEAVITLVECTEGPQELCQVLIAIFQFMRRKQCGVTRINSIAVEDGRVITIPQSSLEHSAQSQKRTIWKLVALVKEFLDRWENRHPGTSSTTPLQQFVQFVESEAFQTGSVQSVLEIAIGTVMRSGNSP